MILLLALLVLFMGILNAINSTRIDQLEKDFNELNEEYNKLNQKVLDSELKLMELDFEQGGLQGKIDGHIKYHPK